MEYFANGSLQSVIRNESFELPWLVRLNMAIDIAKSMLYLHQNNILHRDLKSANVMVNEDKRVKLADFGESTETMSGKLTSQAGTWPYMAVELLSRKDLSYSKAVDVYSYGYVAILFNFLNFLT